MEISRIRKKKYYAVSVKLASPLCISSGYDENTDKDVLRNACKEVFLPGSSIAGAWRDYLGQSRNCDGLMGFSEDEKGRMSPVIVQDLYLSENVRISARDGVKLDSSKGVINKFDMEIVETGASGTLFFSYIERENAQWDYENITETLTLPIPTRSGYVFKGWGTDSSAAAGVTGSYTPNGNVTLYAIWSEPLILYSGEWGELSWALDENGLLTISGSGSMNPLMQYTDDNPIAAWLRYKDKIVSVEVKSGVTNIGGFAFYTCSKLTSVMIPSSVTSSDGWAFYSCAGLTDVTIPDSVTSISYDAFRNCSGLTSITIPNSVTSIGSSAFEGCSGLMGITIPDSVTRIADHAFCDCSSLTSVTIPNNVTYMGGYAFYGCTGLTSVSLSDILTGIGNYTFYNCNSLTSVTIPRSVTYIGNYAFSYCIGLTSVTIPDSVTRIGDHAFRTCTGLTSVTIGNGVTSIGEGAFVGCRSLMSVSIPSSVTYIGNYAFYDCGALNTVKIDSIAAWCGISFASSDSNPLFNEKSNLYLDNVLLTELIIPEGVTSIGDYAFYGCRSLTSVTIPEDMTSIGNYAFHYCSGLTSVTIPVSVTTIGSLAFDGYIQSVYYSGIKEQWKLISIGSGNDFRQATIYYLEPDFVLPTALTAIEAEAFAGGVLTYAKLPEGTASIGSRAFADCPNLRYTYIPAATTEIAADAFENVTGLTILGKTGTIAESYAQDHGCSFIAIS